MKRFLQLYYDIAFWVFNNKFLQWHLCISQSWKAFPVMALLEESVKCNCFGNISQQHQERLWYPCGFKTQIISTVFSGLFFPPWSTLVLITRCWQLDKYSFAWYSTDIFKSPIIYQMGWGRADKNKLPTVDGQSFRSPKNVSSSKVALLQRDENHPNGVEKLLLFRNHLSVEEKERHLHY